MFFTALMHQSNAVVAVISQMITPAIFILATGNLVGSALTRLVRCVDRARKLLAELRELPIEDPEALFTLRQIGVYRRRVTLLENILSFYYFAIFVFVAASLAIALDVIFGDHFPWLATFFTLVGATCVLVGSALFLVETRLATGGLREEIDRAFNDRRNAVSSGDV